MSIDGKSADFVSKGQSYAHELTEGTNTANINHYVHKIDDEINSISNPAQRQQVLAAMDKELSDRGLLPSALQLFAEQPDNHKILKADCRGMHQNTLDYNLDPTNPEYAPKLKNSGSWDAAKSPVEMMLTHDLRDKLKYITNKLADNDPAADSKKENNHEVQYKDLDAFVKRSNEKFMSDHLEQLQHGTVPVMSDSQPTPAAPASPDSLVHAPAAKKDAPAAIAKTTDAKASEAEAKDAKAITAKDTHSVKAGETLQSIAIDELKAEGKLSETATTRDLQLAHKQIAYEEHLIRLYTPNIFAKLPNYNGKLQDKWVFNLVPQQEMQKELDENKTKHHLPKGA